MFCQSQKSPGIVTFWRPRLNRRPEVPPQTPTAREHPGNHRRSPLPRARRCSPPNGPAVVDTAVATRGLPLAASGSAPGQLLVIQEGAGMTHASRRQHPQPLRDDAFAVAVKPVFPVLRCSSPSASRALYAPWRPHPQSPSDTPQPSPAA